jgi:hypothetical protein
MNMYSFEVDPSPNRFFDRDGDGTVPDEFFTGTSNNLAEQLEVAYLERVSRYKQDIKKGYQKIRFVNSSLVDKRPIVKVDLPGGTEAVVFDEELDARLMEIYVLHGWDGILKLEQALEHAQKKLVRVLEPWLVVLPFYSFTRNRLILLIRQALIEIEKKAAQDIFARLNLTAITVNTAWLVKFVFSSKEEVVDLRKDEIFRDTPVLATKITYTMGNRQLSDDLFFLLSEAVNARAFVDEQNRKIKRLEQVIEYFKHEGTSPPNNYEPDIKDAQNLIHQKNTVLETLLEQIRKKAPLALLAMPLLKKGFRQPDMENIIGEALSAFYGKIDKLAEAIKPQTSQIETNFLGIQENVPNATRTLESLFSFGYNIEVLATKKAISEAVDNPAYLALLSEETLNRLIETRVIERGTLAHIVCRRYTLTLMEQIENRRKSEENLKTFVEALARMGAGLSLAALASSGNPEVSAPIKFVAFVLGIPMMLFQIYSVVHQLSVFDQVINLRLAEADTTSIESLVALGEITAMRAEYAQQITETISKEIVLLIAAGKWEIFKQGLHLRGYYADLELFLLEG